MEIALAEFTTDGDVAIDPDLLSSDPLIEEAMRAAGSRQTHAAAPSGRGSLRVASSLT